MTGRAVAVHVLVATVVLSYVGYLVRGEMPLIGDAGTMAGWGLGLGLIAAVLAIPSLVGNATWPLVSAGVALVLGTASLAWGQAPNLGPTLLAAFMVAVVVTWALVVVAATGRDRVQGAHGLK
jgi:hypothetical protein